MAYSKAYRAAHAIEIKAYQAAWYLANRERLKARQADYRTTHKAGLAARDAARYATHSDEVKVRAKAWRAANPARYKVLSFRHVARRRALKRAAEVRLISARDMRRLRRGPCAYCGTSGRLQLDHVIPLSRGGRHAIGNLVAACLSCNDSKNAKLLIEWRVSRSVAGRPR